MVVMGSAFCSSVRAGVRGIAEGVDAVAMVEVDASATCAGCRWGQVREMWPCFWQQKHCPSAWSLCLSSSVKVALALVCPISMAFGSLGRLKAFCHCPFVPPKRFSLLLVLSLRNIYS